MIFVLSSRYLSSSVILSSPRFCFPETFPFPTPLHISTFPLSSSLFASLPLLSPHLFLVPSSILHISPPLPDTSSICPFLPSFLAFSIISHVSHSLSLPFSFPHSPIFNPPIPMFILASTIIQVFWITASTSRAQSARYSREVDRTQREGI